MKYKSSHISLLTILAISSFGLAGCVQMTAATRTPAVARAEVTFVDPDKFSDAADSYRGSDWGRAANLEELKDFIERKASVYIPEGLKVLVKITDVDLAGEIEPGRGAQMQDVRIVKEIYAPRIELSFQLVGADGTILKEGTRHLTNLTFLMDIQLDRSDARVYDKRLLDDWMRSEFASKK